MCRFPTLTLSRSYEAALDTLRSHNVTGVSLHIYASEHDHLDEETDVEETLGERWTRWTLPADGAPVPPGIGACGEDAGLRVPADDLSFPEAYSSPP